MFAVDQRIFEADVDTLLSSVIPIETSNERRSDVVSFIRHVITTRINKTFIVECGSSALKSYLPESDLDLVLLSPDTHEQREEMNLLTGIFNAICEEISDKEDGLSNFSDMTIRNVEFVNARTKLAHCLVNNIAVDITVNQVGALATVGFLEEADRLIGCDHLFKRSVLIIKTWCQHESAKYCGVPILGAKVGMLSSFAISVMVLHVFNKFTSNLTHPFSVLRSFFFTYMNFPWETHVLTLEGPQMIVNGSDPSASTSSYVTSDKNGTTSARRPSRTPIYPNHPKYALFQNRFLPTIQKYRSHPAFLTETQVGNEVIYESSRNKGQGRFSIRCCNIQDPLDSNNNLGISVSRANLQLIEQAFRCGYQHLENSLAPYALANNLTNVVQFNVAAGSYENSQPAIEEDGSAAAETMASVGSGVADNMGVTTSVESSPSAQTSLSSQQVKLMLQPGPPGNLGYVGNPPATNQHQTATPLTIVTDTTSSVPNSNVGIAAIETQNSSGVSQVGSYDDTDLSHQSSIAMSGPAMVMQLSPQPPRGVFLQEFFPMTLNMYAASVRGALRHDLMEHPLQAVAASRGMGTVVFSRNTNNSIGSSSANSKGGTGSGPSGQKNRSRGNSENILGPGNTSEIVSIASERSEWSEGDASPTGNSSFLSDPLSGNFESITRSLQLAAALKNLEGEYPSSLMHSPVGAQQWDESESLTSRSPAATPDKLAGALSRDIVRSLGPLFSSGSLKYLDSYSHQETHQQDQAICVEPLTLIETDNIEIGVQTSPYKKTPVRSDLRLTEKERKLSTDSLDDGLGSGNGSDSSNTVPYLTGNDTETSGNGDNLRVKTDRDTDNTGILAPAAEMRSSISPSKQKELSSGNLVSHENKSQHNRVSDPSGSNHNRRSSSTIQEHWEEPTFRSSSSEEKVKAIDQRLSADGRAVNISTDIHRHPQPTQSIHSKSRASRSKKGNNSLYKWTVTWLNKRISAIERTKVFRSFSAFVRSCQEKLLHCLEALSLDHIGEIINRQLKILNLSTSQTSLIVALFYSILMILVVHFFSSYGGSLIANQHIFSVFAGRKMSTLHILDSSPRISLSRPSMNNSMQQSSIEQTDKKLPPTIHWVKLGDSISFGDFSSYAITAPSRTRSQSSRQNNKNVREPTFSPTSFFHESSDGSDGITGSGVGQAAGFGDCLFGEECESNNQNNKIVERRSSELSEYPQEIDADGIPVRIMYQWVLNGRNIPHTHHNKPYYTIRKSQIKDAGLYQCFKYIYYEEEVSNSDKKKTNGRVQKELIAETNIQISKEPKVKTKPSYQEVTIGTTVFLNLKVEGHPPPAFQWYKNGYIMPGEENQALVMENVNHTHSGTYSCDVQNIAGGYIWLEATVLVI